MSEDLSQGGVAVIVGTRSTNIGGEFRDNPRLIFWDSTDKDTAWKELPSNTRAVLMTRFIPHSIFSRVMAEARRRHITIFPGLQGTGELKRILTDLVKVHVCSVQEVPMADQQTPTTSQEDPNYPPPSRPTTTLTAWVLAHADLHTKSIADEGKRLLEMAPRFGFTTTLGGLVAAIRVNKKKLGLPNLQPHKGGRRKKVVAKSMEHLEKAGIVERREKVVVPSSNFAGASVMQLLTDAIAALQLAKEEYTKTIRKNALLESKFETLMKTLKG